MIKSSKQLICVSICFRYRTNNVRIHSRRFSSHRTTQHQTKLNASNPSTPVLNLDLKHLNLPEFEDFYNADKLKPLLEPLIQRERINSETLRFQKVPANEVKARLKGLADHGESTHLPKFPQYLNKDTLNLYIRFLTTRVYKPKVREAVVPIIDLLLAKDETFSLLDQRSFNSIASYYLRYEFREKFRYLVDLLKVKNVKLDTDWFSVLMDSTVNGKTRYGAQHLSYFEILKEKELVPDAKLVYKIYYSLDLAGRDMLLGLLKEKGVPLNHHFKEFILPQKFQSSNQLLSFMNSNVFEVTPGLVQLVCELFFKEGKPANAWRALLFFFSRGVQITPNIGYLFIESLIDNDMSYFIPSFVYCFNYLTGTRLNLVGYERMLEVQLNQFQQFKDMEKAGLKSGFDYEKWKNNIIAIYHLSSESDRSTKAVLSDKLKAFTKMMQVERIELNDPLNNSTTKLRKQLQFRRSFKHPGFVPYKTLWKTMKDENGNPIHDLFYPPSEAELQLREVISKRLSDGDATSAYSVLDSAIQKKLTKLDQYKALMFFDYFNKKGQFYNTFALLALFESKYQLQLRDEVYLMICQELENWPLTYGLRFLLTTLKKATSPFTFTRLREIIWKQKVENSKFKIDVFAEPSRMAIDKLQMALKDLKWEEDGIPKFELASNTVAFRRAASYVIIPSSVENKLTESPESFNPDLEWQRILDLPDNSQKLEALRQLSLEFIKRDQMYNVYVLARFCRGSYPELEVFADYESYEIMLSQLIDDTTRKLGSDELRIIKILYESSSQLSFWEDRALIVKIKNKLRDEGLSFDGWELNSGELKWMSDAILNLRWKNKSPEFELKKNTKEFQRLAMLFCSGSNE
ncbi:unnamed protein product [Ambrosiozyma monospora]|uniref:Unnamed protein product n=1 Tax=Ambrosiozyma monospora TaxID=43982 RepID=A0A9W6Z0Y8_AMBMO|nr:unnamed protein product [Ambrosiozyma monospora]